MPRFKVSLLAAAGILLLAFVLNAVGPKRVMAALGYTPIRDVDNPGRHPFQAQLNGPNGSFTVPQNKRLVIEQVSGILVVAGGGDVSNLFITTTTQGLSGPVTLSHPIAPGSAIGPGLTRTSEPVHFYADPGTVVSLGVGETGGNSVSFVVSGYLVDLP